uniref:Uncharacterized protein n=1 Tax=Physcomitrium patens TaxID=3218 RepID=A0A2K1ID65_PHYPA|nr:hypothetical protein PHYPA_030687 [Physcomitrium patens]
MVFSFISNNLTNLQVKLEEDNILSRFGGLSHVQVIRIRMINQPSTQKHTIHHF